MNTQPAPVYSYSLGPRRRRRGRQGPPRGFRWKRRINQFPIPTIVLDTPFYTVRTRSIFTLLANTKKLNAVYGTIGKVHTKMPGQKIGMQKSHLAVTVEKRTKELVRNLLTNDDDDVIYGRVETNLGTYFRVKIHDGKQVREILAAPTGLLRKRKTGVRFGKGDFILVEGDLSVPPGKERPFEMTALLDKKDVQTLYKTGKIHEAIYKSTEDESGAPVDDIFDYSGEQEEDDGPSATMGGKVEKKDKIDHRAPKAVMKKVEDKDDIDIDAI